MSSFSKDTIVESLSRGVCGIIFTKRDGTRRVMDATTKIEFIPEKKRPTAKTEPNYNPTIVRAFDIGIGEWRTIRIDSITSFNNP